MNRGATEFVTVFRGLAIFLVLIAHIKVFFNESFVTVSRVVGEFGKFGVVLFFVISGFTIAFQLERLDGRVRDFLVLRFLRIYSLFLPVSIAFVVVSYAVGSALPGYEYWILSAWLFEGRSNQFIGVEWTLEVEVICYIIFGLMCLGCRYFRLPVLGVAVVLGSLFMALWLIILIFKGYLDYPISSIYSPFRYVVFFFFGYLAYMFRASFTQNRQSVLGWLVILILWVILYILSGLSSHLGVFFMSVLFSFVLVKFSGDGKSVYRFSGVFVEFFRFLGGLSFSIYLVHYPVFVSFATIDSLYFNIYTAIFVTFILSLFFQRVFEIRLYTFLKARFS